AGGLFSVALSVGRPRGLAARVYPISASLRRRLQVTRHRALWCSDFPPPARAGSGPPPFQNQRTAYSLSAYERKASQGLVFGVFVKTLLKISWSSPGGPGTRSHTKSESNLTNFRW